MLLFADFSAFPASAIASASLDNVQTAPEAVVHTRFAVHDDFDRVVFKLPLSAVVSSHLDGSILSLRFAGAGKLTGDAVAGRRALSMSSDRLSAKLQCAPNARVRSWRAGDLFVVDVFEASEPVKVSLASPPGVKTLLTQSSRARQSSSRNDAESSSASSSVASKQSERTDVQKVSHLAAIPAPISAPVSAAPAQPQHPLTGLAVQQPTAQNPIAGAQSVTSHTVSVAIVQDGEDGAPALLVPFGPGVGAAAFVRGGEARVVFDAPQSFDLSGLRDDAAFGGVTEELLPDGMQLRFHASAASMLRLSKRDGGWVVALQRPRLPPQTQRLAPIAISEKNHAAVFDASAAGRVVVIDDGLTGGRLLVGTQRVPGQHVGSIHLSAEASILPTWQGVVVQPASDRLLLRTTPAGFELSSIDGPPLAMTWSDQQTGAWPDGRAMTRLFDFPSAPPDALHRLLGQALRDAAAVPKLARFAPRLRVAQVMLAQGLDVEAAAVLRTARADDPAGHDRLCAECLEDLAAWMSARAGGDEAPRTVGNASSFGDSDEGAFLKALLAPNAADVAAQAAAVASTWPLLLSYPPALRRYMLEPVAALLARGGGQEKASSAFLSAFPDPSLDLARADFLCSRQQIDECLKSYDRIASGRDRLARANALERSVLVRMASHRMSPVTAADALTHQLYAWRGGDRELRLRQRIADLRVQGGQWRSALNMLNEVERDFPEARADVQSAKAGLVRALLSGDNVAKLSAIDLVAIANQASDVSDGDVAFAPALIDKLLALDLATRADPILHRMFLSATDASTKAELGVRLAESMLDAGDASSALTVLQASDNADLGEKTVTRRAMLRARLLDRSGKPLAALEALGSVHTRDASELKAAIMEGQHDWASAVAVLKPLVFGENTTAEPEADRGGTVLRLARDEAEAGDQAGLTVLRHTQSARFRAGPNAALFGVLTAEPVRSTADLPRSALEVKALREVPAEIAAGHHL